MPTPWFIVEDLDMELRMTRLEDIMDRRPLLLNRFVGGVCGGFVGVLWG